MNKLLFTAVVLIYGMNTAQIHTPTGGINSATTNPQTGNVGIGTDNPQTKLDINGDISFGEAGSNTLFRDNAGSFGSNIRSGFYQTTNPVNFPNGATSWWHLLDVRHSNPTNNYALQIAGSFFDQNLWFRKTSDNPSQPWRKILAEQSNGNVGIGTDNPQAKLEVNGNVNIGGNTYIPNPEFVNIGNGNDTNVALMFGDTRLKIGYLSSTSSLITDSQNAQILSQGGSENLFIASRGNISSNIVFHTSNGSGLLEKMRIDSNGNIGIGTNTPQAKLDVRGRVNLQEIAFTNTDGGDNSDPYRLRKVQGSNNNSWLELQLNDDSDESFRIYGNSCDGYGCGEYSSNLYHSFDASGNVYHKGNVGIGTNTPEGKLDINANGNIPIIRGNGGYIPSGLRFIDDSYSQSGEIKEWAIWKGNTWVKGLGFMRYDAVNKCAGGICDAPLLLYDNGSISFGIAQSRIDIPAKVYLNDNMSINAKLEAKEIKVTTTPTADFVFAEDYHLPKLEEVEKHIKEKKHLPEIASAKEMEKEGVNIGEFQIKLLQKIEELTLYSIEQNRRMIEQNKQIEELKKEIKGLKNKK